MNGTADYLVSEIKAGKPVHLELADDEQDAHATAWSLHAGHSLTLFWTNPSEGLWIAVKDPHDDLHWDGYAIERRGSA